MTTSAEPSGLDGHPAARSSAVAGGRSRVGSVTTSLLTTTTATVASAGAALAVVREPGAWSVVVGLVAVAWAVSGGIVGRSRHVGRLGAPMAGAGFALAGALVASTSSASSDAAVAVQAVLTSLALALAFHVLVTLPRGAMRATSTRWLVAGGYLAVVPLAVATIDRHGARPEAIAWATAALMAVAAGVSFAAEAGRVGSRDRARLQWDAWGVIVAGTIAVGAWALSALTGWPASPALVAVAGSCVVPAGIACSTSERALTRVGRVMVATIVGVGLVAVVTAIYLVIVVGFDGLPDAGERTIMMLSLAAAALAAIAVVPARERLLEFANQRIYGERTAPDETLRTFATRMSRSVPMDELLLQLAESLRKTMDLESAEVWTGADGTFERQISVPRRSRAGLRIEGEELGVAARAKVVGNGWLSVWLPALLDGRGECRMRVAPIAHLGELLGFIVAERGIDDQPFSEEEDAVLGDLTRQVGLALHNVRLDSALQASLDELQVRNIELQASRARIVAAADESRRRIERNLHDGAQQHLVAMAVKLGLARQLLQKDPSIVDGLLEELRADVQLTVGELRELAHGIYPPLLRDRGIGEALVAAANRSPIPTAVEAGGVGRFDTELEAAVYFCCLEAMQNAGKHAGDGATIAVTVTRTGDEVAFSIADDGAGFDTAAFAGGHGFVNMGDRLGAIGGRLQVDSAVGAGTTISGSLPVPAEPPT